MKTALITGSNGLLGSACRDLLLREGWRVFGIDNNGRKDYFGPDGSTKSTVNYICYNKSVADIETLRGLLPEIHPDFIIHTAAQPSHDRSADIPFQDFHTNATGTLNLLEMCRCHCPESPFIHISTSKVYEVSARPSSYREMPLRYGFILHQRGVSESWPIGPHTLFGCSKTYGDLVAQEYAACFGMSVVVFRPNCISGPNQSAVPLHGALNYIVKCAVTKTPYTILGYKGKQVRDQIHADDLAELCWQWYQNPKTGVYNVGGGYANSISILETIKLLDEMGIPLADYNYSDMPRKFDHIVYYTDLAKVKKDYPKWEIRYSVRQMVEQIAERYQRTVCQAAQ